MVRWFPTNSIQKRIQVVTTETHHLRKQLSKRNTNLKKRGERTPSETHQINSLLNRVEQQASSSNGIVNSGRYKNIWVLLQEWHNRLLMKRISYGSQFWKVSRQTNLPTNGTTREGLNEEERADNTDRSRNGGRISVWLSVFFPRSFPRICFACEPRGVRGTLKSQTLNLELFSQIFIYKTLSLELGCWGWNPTRKP
jgi:hypothetical protein